MSASIERLLASQRTVGAVLFGMASLVMASLMARHGHTHWGVGWGTLADFVAAIGALGMLGMIRRREPGLLAPPQDGVPALGASPYRATPADGSFASDDAPVLTPALILLALGAIVLVPDLGFGLWDPWETHYGEVAREILSRDDWISLWWQDEWFWSKPILLFWMSALAMGLLGVPAGPDGGAHGYTGAIVPVSFVTGAIAAVLLVRIVRAARRHGRTAALVRAVPFVPLALVYREVWVCHARGTTLELALRLPVVLWAIAALVTLGWATERLFGRRAALWSGIVLLSTPYWALLAHQSMVDMPFVAALTMAMCLLLVAWHADGNEPAPVRTIEVAGVRLELSAMMGVVAALVVLILPQVLYLITRHVTLGHPFLSLHEDEFAAGSASHGALRPGSPHLRWLPPALQALLVLVPTIWILKGARDEHRLRPALLLAFYVLSALSFMGKGLPGVGLPGLVALVALAVTGRWRLLRELKIGAGTAIVCTVGLPWFVAMFTRHGPRFTDRLLIHDHINRLTVGVHGDTGSLQYFLGQLGYGMFPWSGLLVLGAAAIFVLPPEPFATERREQVHAQILLWFVLSFALFSMMVTKFHHYVFPAVPPLAMLVGIALDRVTPPDSSHHARPWVWRAGFVAAMAAAVLVPTWMMGTVADARWDFSRSVPVLSLFGPGGIALAVLLAGALALGARAGLAGPRDDTPGARAGMAAVFVGAAALLALVTRDLGDATSSGRPKGTERLIHLFIYNYQRAWPQGFDASDVFVAFGTVAAVLVLLAASVRLRRMAVTGLLITTLAFSVWAIHGHMGPLTQHWSQQHLIRTYYSRRASADERLVAWQMNWKGENLYTGNRVEVFVSLDNDAVEKWITDHRGQTHWFILEKGRLANLRRLLSCTEETCPVADDSSNKFALLRARL